MSVILLLFCNFQKTSVQLKFGPSMWIQTWSACTTACTKIGHFNFSNLIDIVSMPTCFFHSGQRFCVILCLCVLSHLQTLTGFYQYDYYLLRPLLPPQLKLLLVFFFDWKKREIHVHSGVILQCLCPSIWRNFLNIMGHVLWNQCMLLVFLF